MKLQDGFVGWPELFAAKYRSEGCWNGWTLYAYLRDSQERFADKTAIVDDNVRLSYTELLKLVDRLAQRLYEKGFRPQDTVVIQLPNRWELVVFLFACLRLGVVPVMALPGHRAFEIGYFIDHVEAKGLAIPDSLRSFDHLGMGIELKGRCPTLSTLFVLNSGQSELDSGAIDLDQLILAGDDQVDPQKLATDLGPSSEEIALFLLSGGTTGVPKLIPRTHDDYGYNFRISSERCRFSADTVYGTFLPASHNFPLACPGILGTLHLGGTVVMGRSPEPSYALSLIEKEGITVTAVVPAVAQKWLEHFSSNPKYNLSSLDVLQVGGARMAPELAFRVGPVLGCKLQQVFGMAEGLVNYTDLDDPEETICETQGRPMSPFDEIRIVDEQGAEVPEGEMGQLLTRGPYTLRGYYRAPEHNQKAFTDDGWYRTGDVVRRDSSGSLVVLGRTKDLINRAGEKISAEEIENLLYRISNVEHAAVVSLPDAQKGELVCAVIVLKDKDKTLTLDSLRSEFDRFEIAGYKYPERLELVDELPLTNVGKIDKAKLRSELLSSSN